MLFLKNIRIGLNT